jgi:hypothetical protein
MRREIKKRWSLSLAGGLLFPALLLGTALAVPRLTSLPEDDAGVLVSLITFPIALPFVFFEHLLSPDAKAGLLLFVGGFLSNVVIYSLSTYAALWLWDLSSDEPEYYG